MKKHFTKSVLINCKANRFKFCIYAWTPFLFLFLLISPFGNAQVITIDDHVNSSVAPYETISLDKVFNITSISQEAKILLPELPSEKTDLDSLAIPPIIGIIRDIEEPLMFPSIEKSKSKYDVSRQLTKELTEDSLLVFTTSIQSINAKAVRVRFSLIDSLPQGTNIYVYTAQGEIFGPYISSMFYDNIYWSHMVFSDEVYIQIQTPASGFIYDKLLIVIDKVAHIFSEEFNDAHNKSNCLEDVNCSAANGFSHINSLRNSVASVATIGANSPWVSWCSGVLLNNNNPSQSKQPIFQTVNHCVPEFRTAQQSTFFFDYRTISCNSSSLATREQINGATQLWNSTSSGQDYSLLLLREKPTAPFRIFKGWSTSEITNGAIVHLVSHPDGLPQKYTRAEKTSTLLSVRCQGTATVTDYIKYLAGTTYGGSSGGAWVNATGHVVGAHIGKCNRNILTPIDDCNYDSFFAGYARLNYYYSSVQQWLQGTAATNLGVSTTSISFSTVNANSWTERTIRFTNTTNAGFNLDLSMSILGTNANQFSLKGVTNLYIPPGGNRDLVIRYQPSSGGAHIANLRISHNATNLSSPLYISLSGCAILSQPGSISGPLTPCSGIASTYSISSVTGATSYEWQYSGGGTPIGSGTSVSLSPTSNGELRVRALNSCGPSPWRTRSLYVSYPPSTPGSISGESNVCSGYSYAYSILSVSGATSYSWEYTGGGTPSGTGTSITLAPTSSGTLRVRANNSCGSSSWRSMQISVTATPATPGSISGQNSVCSGSTNTYNISSVSGASSYTWEYSGGGTPSGSGTNVTLTPTSSGTLRVRANSAGCSSSWRTMSITVVSNPSIPGAITAPQTTCSGQPITISISPVSGATYYEWFYSGNGTITGSGTTITLYATSSGTLSVRACNACGCSGMRSLNISLSTTPAMPGPISGPTNVISGSSNTYSISSVSGATSYSWSFTGTGTPSGSGTSVTLSPTSSGTLRVTANNSCGSSAQRTLEIQVGTPQTLTVTNHSVPNNATECFDATQTIILAGSGTNFVVQNGGVATFIAGQNIRMLPGLHFRAGSQVVAYISSGGPFCGGGVKHFLATEEEVGVETGEIEFSDSAQSPFFKIYPNPTTGGFTLELSQYNENEKIFIEIFSMRGEVIHIKEVPGDQLVHRLSLEGHLPGLYFVRIIQGNKVGVERIIKR